MLLCGAPCVGAVFLLQGDQAPQNLTNQSAMESPLEITTACFPVPDVGEFVQIEKHYPDKKLQQSALFYCQ